MRKDLMKIVEDMSRITVVINILSLGCHVPRPFIVHADGEARKVGVLEVSEPKCWTKYAPV